MTFLRNTWYMAAWSHEIEEGTLLARTILNEPIVLFRQTDGSVAAVADRCPHRFAPLHAGTVSDGRVRCRYHGLEFDGKGACVHNPHGDGSVPRASKITAYPVHEQDLIVWVWMGKPEQADRSRIPDYSFLAAAPATCRNVGYMLAKANYQLMSDNIMDLSHVDYLHPDSLGGGSLSRSTAEVTEEGDSVRICWTVTQDTVPPAFAHEMPDPTLPADQQTHVVWTAPGWMRLKVDIDVAEPLGLYAEALHMMTPESETTTHYFYANVRGFRADDVEFTKIVDRVTVHAFTNEDKPMVEAQQRAMGGADLFALKPVLLPIDAGAIRARRKLAGMIAEERAVS